MANPSPAPAPVVPAHPGAAAPGSPLRDLSVRTLPDSLTAPASLWREYSHAFASLAVNLTVAALIMVVTSWAAKWLSGLARSALARTHHGHGDGTLPAFAASLTRYVVFTIGAVAALQQLGVKTTSVLAVLGAASIAIGLALQGALSNVAAGVMILLFRPYRVGDLIETGGKLGTVKTLDLFVTELATPDNLRVMAPNGKIFGDVIVNYTTYGRRRVDVVFHVPPQRDLGAVLQALRQRIEADPRVMRDPAPIVEATSLNEAFAEGAVRVWAKLADYSAVRTDMVLAAQALAREPEAARAPEPAQA